MEMDIDRLPAAPLDPKLLSHAAESGGSAAFYALSDHHIRDARSLRNDDRRSLLHVAAASGRADARADANLTNDGGRTALHYAASKVRLEIAELLLAHGAKFKKDKVGCLHQAASTGNSQLCELLIEGAEVDAIDNVGQTLLMSAVICENREVALLLIRHGADVDVEDKEGYTVLGRASNDLSPALTDAAKAMLEG